MDGTGAPKPDKTIDPASTSVRNGSTSAAWIEYTVTGDAEVQGREEDVVMCSESDDGFRAAALGDWVFHIESEQNGTGEHAVTFMISAPDDLPSLHDDNFRTDDRFRGDGTMVIESAGKDQFGFALIKAEFSGVDLQSDAEHTISVKGILCCAVM